MMFQSAGCYSMYMVAQIHKLSKVQWEGHAEICVLFFTEHNSFPESMVQDTGQ